MECLAVGIMGLSQRRKWNEMNDEDERVGEWTYRAVALSLVKKRERVELV